MHRPDGRAAQPPSGARRSAAGCVSFKLHCEKTELLLLLLLLLFVMAAMAVVVMVMMVVVVVVVVVAIWLLLSSSLFWLSWLLV